MTLESITAPERPTPKKESLTGGSESQGGARNKDVTDKRLKGAVKDLEALFFYEMMKEMRKTTQGGFLGKGMGGDIYNSLFDMEMSKLFAERGFGLGEIILKQIIGREEKRVDNQITTPKELELSPSPPKPNPLSSTGPQSKEQGARGPEPKITPRIPVKGRISSSFGWRSDPFSGEKKFHGGMDIAAPTGQEIYPINHGKVIFSGMMSGYGNTVVIDHGDGYVSKYGHNLTNLVSQGDKVETNQVVALVGNTGKSTGPHLHFEVEHQGKRINPQDLIEFNKSDLG